MPVGRGSVARAAKAAAGPKKPAQKAKKAEEATASVITAPSPEVLDAFLTDPVGETVKKKSAKKTSEPRMQRGVLSGIMVIKSDLPIELL